MNVKVYELTADRFVPYGKILSRAQGAPLADDEVIRYWGKVGIINFQGDVSTGLLLGQKREFITDKLERHTGTPEVLAALDSDAVVLVAESGDEPENLRAFYIKQGDAVVLNCGTWHWTPFPVGKDECKFLVMFSNDTETKDLIIKELGEELHIDSEKFFTENVTREK